MAATTVQTATHDIHVFKMHVPSDSSNFYHQLLNIIGRGVLWMKDVHVVTEPDNEDPSGKLRTCRCFIEGIPVGHIAGKEGNDLARLTDLLNYLQHTDKAKVQFKGVKPDVEVDDRGRYVTIGLIIQRKSPNIY